MQATNGRRITTAPRLKREFYQRPENSEIVNYVCESWNEVNRVFRNKSSNVIYYQRDPAAPNLNNFEPFDLESYWGKRVVQNQNCRGNRSP